MPVVPPPNRVYTARCAHITGIDTLDFPPSQLLDLWLLKAGAESAKWLLNWQLYAAVALLLLVTPWFAAQRPQRGHTGALMHDYLYGVLHTLLVVPTYTVVLACQQFLTERYLPGLQMQLLHQLPIAAQILVAFVVSDFLVYLAHYLKHRLRPLWYFHMTHHSQLYLNPFTTKRTHIVEHLFSKGLVRWLPLAVMGSPLEVWLLLYWTCAFWDYFVHSNLRITLGPLRWVLVSPQYHRIHHASQGRFHDRNFGDKLVLWDLMFGTACMDPDIYPETGIDDPDYPRESGLNPLRHLRTWARQWCYPFRRLWRDLQGRSDASTLRGALGDGAG